MPRKTYPEAEAEAFHATVDALREVGLEFQRGRTRSRCKCISWCFYCDLPLKGLAHHHDHFPLPARYGGELTVPACVSCHKLKEKGRVDQWPIEAISEVLVEMQHSGPWTRMVLAKLLSEVCYWHDEAVKLKNPDPPARAS